MSEFRPDSDPLVLRLDRAARILCNTPEMRDSDDLMLVSALLTEAGNDLARLRAALAEIRDLHQPTWTSEAAKAAGKNPWVCELCGTADGHWPCYTHLTANDALPKQENDR